MFHNKKSCLAGLAVSALVLQGCASLESEVDPEWEGPEVVERHSEIAATEDGSRLVVGNPRVIAIFDDEGRAVGAFGDTSFLDRVDVTVRGPGGIEHSLSGGASNIIMLPQAGKVLILDYRGTTERVTAMDLETGEEAWQRTDFAYSIQQYEGLVDQAVEIVGGAIADALGAELETERPEDRRQRHRRFANQLVAEVDGGDGVLFKTFDGLVKLDTRAGSQRWHVEDFNGPGIADVQELDNGDYLVLSTGQDLYNLMAAEEYNLARISRNGEVRWMTEHAGRDTGSMVVEGDRVVVDGSPLQVFDANSGEKRWENDIERRTDFQTAESGNRRAIKQPKPLIVDGVLYQTAPSGWDEDGGFFQFADRHHIKAYDLDSGEVLWEIEDSRTFFGPMERINDRLLVWGIGEFFDEEDRGGGVAAVDADSGEVLWQSRPLETPGLFSAAPFAVAPVFDEAGERVYIGGPEELLGFRISDGEEVFDIETDGGLGDAIGLVGHDDRLVRVGLDGTAAYDMDNGDELFAVSHETAVDYEIRGERVFVHLSGAPFGGAAESDDDDDSVDPRGVIAINLADGSASAMAAWDDFPFNLMGTMEEGRAFIPSDGRFVYGVGEDGRLLRFGL